MRSPVQPHHLIPNAFPAQPLVTHWVLRWDLRSPRRCGWGLFLCALREASTAARTPRPTNSPFPNTSKLSLNTNQRGRTMNRTKTAQQPNHNQQNREASRPPCVCCKWLPAVLSRASWSHYPAPRARNGLSRPLPTRSTQAPVTHTSLQVHGQVETIECTWFFLH